MTDAISLVGPRKVRFAKEAIRLFNLQWPCSELSADRAYWFEFDESGDLVDCDVPEHSDGAAALALSQDALAWLDEEEEPQWLFLL